MAEEVRPLYFADGRLKILDQRLLPHEVRYVTCGTAEEVAGAIRTMIVRGAPAIGVAAAFGLAVWQEMSMIRPSPAAVISIPAAAA